MKNKILKIKTVSSVHPPCPNHLSMHLPRRARDANPVTVHLHLRLSTRVTAWREKQSDGNHELSIAIDLVHGDQRAGMNVDVFQHET